MRLDKRFARGEISLENTGSCVEISSVASGNRRAELTDYTPVIATVARLRSLFLKGVLVLARRQLR